MRCSVDKSNDRSCSKICPFCQTKIASGDSILICAVCGMPHHTDCWNENKGCSIYGCKGKDEPALRVNPPEPLPPQRIQQFGLNLKYEIFSRRSARVVTVLGLIAYLSRVINEVALNNRYINVTVLLFVIWIIYILTTIRWTNPDSQS